MPVLMILGTVGFMFGTGGTALVALTYGEGDKEKANEYFSLFVFVAFVIGVILAIWGFIFIRPLAVILGATGDLLENSVIYGRIILLLFVALNVHSKGVGYAAWCAVEKMYPQVKIWETCTPYFEKIRNDPFMNDLRLIRILFKKSREKIRRREADRGVRTV